jgi:hypothetical protein
MRNRDADAAPVPATDAEVSMAAGLTTLKDLVADWRLTMDVAMTVEQIAERTLSIVTAYLAGELPPAMAAEVTDILRTEPLLRAAHAKLIAAWQAPNAERAVSDGEVDAAYGRFKAMRAARFGGKGSGSLGV